MLRSLCINFMKFLFFFLFTYTELVLGSLSLEDEKKNYFQRKIFSFESKNNLMCFFFVVLFFFY